MDNKDIDQGNKALVGDVDESTNTQLMVYPGSVLGNERLFGSRGFDFKIFGDTVIYYHEGMKHGISGYDLYAMRKAFGPQIREAKQQLVKVDSISVELAPPAAAPNYPKFSGTTLGSILPKYNFERRKKDRLAMKPNLLVKTLDATVAGIVPPTMADRLEANYNKVAKPGLDKTEKERLYISAYTDTFNSAQGTLKVKIQGDDFYSSGGDMSLPHYTPHYETIGPDSGMFSALSLLVHRSTGASHTVLLKLYKDMQKTSEEYILSSGTIEGQLGRLKTGFVTREEVEKTWKGEYFLPSDTKLFQREKFSPQITLPEYIKIMRRRAPVVSTNKKKLWTNSVELMDAGQFLLSFGHEPLYTVNATASSGDYYNGLKRFETIATDRLKATSLLSKLQALEDDRVQAGSVSFGVEVLLKQRSYDRMPKMANKMETGARSKVMTKWRNFFIFNAYEQLPASIFYAGIYDTKEIRMYKSSQTPDLFNLIGWSPYAGGMEDLLRTMAKQALQEGISIAVYSDNLWILVNTPQGLLWGSLDGTSMESSITRTDVALFNAFVLQDFWGSEATAGFRRYVLEYHPHMVCDSFALFGNNQLLNLGQFSGTQGTAYLNNSKMTIAAELLHQKFLQTRSIPFQLNATKLNDNYDQIFLSLGIKLKVEQTTRHPLFEYLGGLTVDLNKLFDDNIVKLDLLAMDVLILSFSGANNVDGVLPILSRDRMLKSLTYNKFLSKRDLKSNTNKVLHQLRLKALYLIGGYAYPGMPNLIRHRLSTDDTVSHRVAVASENKDAESIWNDLVDNILDEEDIENVDGALKQALLSIGIPSFADVIRLSYGNTGVEKMNMVLLLNTQIPDRVEEVVKVNGVVGALDFLKFFMDNKVLYEGVSLTAKEYETLERLLDTAPSTSVSSSYNDLRKEAKRSYLAMMGLGSQSHTHVKKTNPVKSRKFPVKLEKGSEEELGEEFDDLLELDPDYAEEEEELLELTVFSDFDRSRKQLSEPTVKAKLTTDYSQNMLQLLQKSVKSILEYSQTTGKQLNTTEHLDRIFGSSQVSLNLGMSSSQMQTFVNLLDPIVSTVNGGKSPAKVVNKAMAQIKEKLGLEHPIVAVEKKKTKVSKQQRRQEEAELLTQKIERQKREEKQEAKMIQQTDKRLEVSDTENRLSTIRKRYTENMYEVEELEQNELDAVIRDLINEFGVSPDKSVDGSARFYKLNIPFYAGLKQMNPKGTRPWGEYNYLKGAAGKWLERNYANPNVKFFRVLSALLSW